jgi:hypothetical protein
MPAFSSSSTLMMTLMLAAVCLNMGTSAQLPRRLRVSLQPNTAVSLDQPASHARLLLEAGSAISTYNSTQRNDTASALADSKYAKRAASFSSVDDSGDTAHAATGVTDAYTITPDIVLRAKDWLAAHSEEEPAAVVSGGIKKTMQENPSLAFVPYAG